MGIKAVELIEKAGLNREELVKKLNSLYCDEWLSYIQYWTGAQVSSGALNAVLNKELLEHAGEELEHAEKLAKRILELGGTPVIEPKDWYRYSKCGYLAPSNPKTQELLKQNLTSERCAIQAYADLIEYVKDKDLVTCKLAIDIMKDEIEHEQELENIKADMECAC